MSLAKIAESWLLLIRPYVQNFGTARKEIVGTKLRNSDVTVSVLKLFHISRMSSKEGSLSLSVQGKLFGPVTRVPGKQLCKYVGKFM